MKQRVFPKKTERNAWQQAIMEVQLGLNASKYESNVIQPALKREYHNPWRTGILSKGGTQHTLFLLVPQSQQSFAMTLDWLLCSTAEALHWSSLNSFSLAEIPYRLLRSRLPVKNAQVIATEYKAEICKSLCKGQKNAANTSANNGGWDTQ